MALPWRRSAPDVALRDTGISLLGEVPWGAHISVFYENKQDLLDTAVAYFKAGIEAKERCIWAISEPVSLEDAANALRQNIPDFDRQSALGHFDIVTARDWYLHDGRFDLPKLVRSLQDKLYEALESGHAGLRACGNALWQHTALWKDFCEYERALDSSVASEHVLVLCTYALAESSARDILDVARVHQCTIARRHGRWEFLQVPMLEHCKSELRVLNDPNGILPRNFPGKDRLTAREKVVLAQIVRGASSKEAARLLKISPRTVEFHRANIMQKLGVKNTVELVRLLMVDA